jgi:spermidine/putrescine transport system substrate-binding protein
MKPRAYCNALLGLLFVSVLLTGCQGGQRTGTATATVISVPSGKLTKDGFNCPAPNPRVDVSSKELNLYVWSTYVPQDFLECYELIYGIKVNYAEYDSDEEMYGGITKAPSSYDLIQPTDFVVPKLIRDGMLSTLDHSRLPILGNLNYHYMNLNYDAGNQYTIPYESGIDAIAVNTTTVANPPTSWADLWKPEYEGRIVMADDERSVIGLTLLTLGFDVNATEQGQLDMAKRALDVLRPNIKAFNSDDPHVGLISGEVDLAETWNGEAFLAHQKLPTIEFVYPAEGSILWQDNWAMLKTAEHKDAAYAWLNYTMQGDVFWMMLTNFPYTNPNNAALAYAKNNPMPVNDVNGNPTTLGAVYAAYIQSPIANPSADVIKAGHRIRDIGDATAAYDEIWAAIKGNP